MTVGRGDRVEQLDRQFNTGKAYRASKKKYLTKRAQLKIQLKLGLNSTQHREFLKSYQLTCNITMLRNHLK